jgi:hypothetical protein
MAVATKKYDVILIEEGLGNLGTCFYYTRDALVFAAENKVFEGKKCYADHPDAIEAKTRPERSTRDVIGYFEVVRVEDGPAGQALLVGELILPQSVQLDWARVMVETSIDVSGKFDAELLGLSINATGVSEKITLEKFMSESTIPISALPKLLEAQNEGIEEIEVCNKLTEAVSCDMVTEAGAKGRFRKILESEKKRMAKPKVKAPTDPKLKKTVAVEADADGVPGDSGDGASADSDGDHADEDQDVELIKSLLKQYVGSEDPSDEECQAMKQALGNAKEMGMEGEEAEKAAGYAMKMAKHVAAKQAEAAEAGAADDAKPASGSGQPSGGDSDSPAGAPGSGGVGAKSKKESAEMSALRARLEKTEKRLLEADLEKFVEKTIRESKLPLHAQRKFRECLGKPVSERSVTSKLTLFQEAFGLVTPEHGFVNPEKGGAVDSGALSLADCVEE